MTRDVALLGNRKNAAASSDQTANPQGHLKLSATMGLERCGHQLDGCTPLECLLAVFFGRKHHRSFKIERLCV